MCAFLFQRNQVAKMFGNRQEEEETMRKTRRGDSKEFTDVDAEKKFAFLNSIVWRFFFDCFQSAINTQQIPADSGTSSDRWILPCSYQWDLSV